MITNRFLKIFLWTNIDLWSLFDTLLSIFHFSNILFVDPTAGEENLATGMVTIVTTDDKLCLVHKPGINDTF
jgi:exosome complex RNA-binding protein Rrp42 (RNase PH superfamily)